MNCSIDGNIKACIESVKTIYFTIFYTTIMHDDQISEDTREQLLGNLRTPARIIHSVKLSRREEA